MNDGDKKIKFVFFGTPELCVTILNELKLNNYLPVAIVANPDAPIGRKQIITPPATKIWAQKNTVDILQPEKLNEKFIEEISKYNAELFVVVAYGKIIPEYLINLPKFGTINIHYSLLPKYRGATPVESAILNGDKKTGVCIQQMRFALDSGPIIKQAEIEISENETAPELRTRLNEIAKKILVEVLDTLCKNGSCISIEQNENKATICKKIKKEYGEILKSDTDEIKWRKYKAYFGWPGIFYFHDGKRIKIIKAKYENNSFIIERVIPEGGKEIDFNIYS